VTGSAGRAGTFDVQFGRVHWEILARLSHDSLAPLCWRKIVLTLDLFLATIHSSTASPEIDVVDARASFPVRVALSAEVLEAQVLFRVRIVYDLTLVELARGRGKGQGVGIGARTASLETTAAVVGSRRTWRVIIGVPVVSMGDLGHFGAAKSRKAKGR